MSTRTGRKLDMEIVGLVQDAKYSDVKEPAPAMFVVPYRQESSVGALTFYVNTSRAPEATMAEIRPLVAKLDANLPVETLQSMPQSVRDNVVADRLITTLSAAFAGLATLLAGVGLYGVLAFTVAQRTREFGLRMALGADASNVRMLVLRQVGVMALIGGVIGIGAAIGLGILAASQMFEIQRSDPTVLAWFARPDPRRRVRRRLPPRPPRGEAGSDEGAQIRVRLTADGLRLTADG